MKRIVLAIFVLLWVLPAARSANPPVLFFTDLINGPATGNSDSTFSVNGGVYVTIYGNFLTGGAITLNGASCLTVVSAPSTWLWYQRMIVQLTGTCSTGNFVVTTSAGTSNGLSFTINASTIHYVATTGSNANAGTFAAPWLTLPFAVQTDGLTAGHVIYVRSNVQALTDDGQWHAAVTIRAEWSKGTAAQPNALVAYPGATGILLGPSAAGATFSGFGTSDFTATGGGPAGFWTVAELTLQGNNAGAGGASSGDTWRFVGNDFTCPLTANGGGGGGCFTTSFVTHAKVYGNNFHDMNPNTTDRLIQGVYYSSDSTSIEHAWNLHSNNGGRASLQTHSSPVSIGNGFILFDMNIHDNTIHDSREECILIDTMDPSKPGGVQIWNNVFWNCGKDGSGGALHQQLSGDFDQSRGVGSSPPPERWYNNTILTTINTSSCWEANYPDIHTVVTTTNFLQNNLCQVVGTAAYWAPVAYSGSVCGNTDNAAACQTMTGTKDLVFGNGVPTFPNLMTAQVNASPLLANASVSGCPNACVTDLHLSVVSSPAVAAGSTTAPVPLRDHDGLVRGATPSIGAYEFAAAVSTGTASLSVSTVAFQSHIFSRSDANSSQVITLTNTGAGTLTISSIGLTAGNQADFSISTNCGASLAPTNSCTVTATFIPTLAGSRAATLTFGTSASTTPDNVTLSGTALAPPATAPGIFSFRRQGTTLRIHCRHNKSFIVFFRDKAVLSLAALHGAANLADGFSTKHWEHADPQGVEGSMPAKFFIGSRPTWPRMLSWGGVEVIAFSLLAHILHESSHAWVRRIWWVPQIFAITFHAKDTAHNYRAF